MKYHQYRSSLKSFARENRNNYTKSELLVWNMMLKGRRMGHKFTRQKPIGNYIIDFYCAELQIAIEIDGASHELKTKQDRKRDDYLMGLGILTIRYTDESVLGEPEYVYEDINRKLKERSVNIMKRHG
jgi:very-short-patch-repair endonuclease